MKKAVKRILNLGLAISMLLSFTVTAQAGTINFDITLDSSSGKPYHDPYSYREQKSDNESNWYITTTYSPNGFGYFYARSEDTNSSLRSQFTKIDIITGSHNKSYPPQPYGGTAKKGNLFRMYCKSGSSDYILTKCQGRYCP